MPRFVNTRELSQRLRVSEKTIRRHVATGKLPAGQFTDGGRFVFDFRAVQEAIRRPAKAAQVVPSPREAVPA